MKKVIEVYTKMLPPLGLFVTDGGIIKVGGGEMGELSDILIEGKELYLPTDSALKDASYKDKVAFHPIAENILKKRSPVLTAIQSALQTRLLTAGVLLITTLLKAASEQRNGTLKITSPDLLKMLVGHEDVNEGVLQFFNDLVATIPNNPSQSLFNVYLKHGGMIRGEKFARLCSVNSPLVKALEEAQALGVARSGTIPVWGVTPKRKMDVGLLLQVVKTIFPLVEGEGYSSGSNDKIAPYCHALFQSAKTLNDDIATAAKNLVHMEPCKSTIEYLMTSTSVFDELDDVDILRNSIIITEYNDGAGWISESSSRDELIDKNVHSNHRTPVAQQHHQPQHASQAPELAAIKHTVNSVSRIPGTRQPLVNIPEEEYRTNPNTSGSTANRSTAGRPAWVKKEVASHGWARPDDRNSHGRPSSREAELEDKLEEVLKYVENLEDDLDGNRSRGRANDRDSRSRFSSRDNDRGSRFGSSRDRGYNDDRGRNQMRPRVSRYEDDRGRGRGRDSVSSRFGR